MASREKTLGFSTLSHNESSLGRSSQSGSLSRNGNPVDRGVVTASLPTRNRDAPRVTRTPNQRERLTVCTGLGCARAGRRRAYGEILPLPQRTHSSILTTMAESLSPLLRE